VTPTTQALQVFYGTIPLILILPVIWFRKQMLLKDILGRLGRIEQFLTEAESGLSTLEARAGIIFHYSDPPL
jgi:hypothetical protein